MIVSEDSSNKSAEKWAKAKLTLKLPFAKSESQNNANENSSHLFEDGIS